MRGFAHSPGRRTILGKFGFATRATRPKTQRSRREAQAFANEVEAERAAGLVRDYTRAHRVAFAELLVRYLRDFKGKSAKVITYKVESWLEDSGEEGRRLLASRHAELAAAGATSRKASFKVRDTIRGLEWIHKPLCLIVADDINGYIALGLNQVSEATVDREIDTFSAVFRKATRSWGYLLADNPIDGVERPRYFNKRDRRLKPGEEMRLLTALRKLDRENAIKAVVEELLAAKAPNRQYSSKSAQKKAFASLRRALLPEAEAKVLVIPRLEAFLQFQLMTGARRGETLSLTRADVDFETQTAFLAETKNERPRRLSLRRDLIELLAKLPRKSGETYVFDMGYSWLADMWRLACEEDCIHDLRIHDLRHETISRVAEIGEFSLVELQTFSGHRDVRMLLRYAHLRASRMARKLDKAFTDGDGAIREHKGRLTLSRNAGLSMHDLVEGCSCPLYGGRRLSTSRARP